MKAEKIYMSLGVLVIILLAFVIIWKADILGVSEGRLEQDARERQDIESSWQVVQDLNDDMCAMLFYDEEQTDCNYSIYLTRDGLSYGYFYEQGGFDPYMTESAKAIVLEDIGIALFSLNQKEICRIEVSSNTQINTITVAPEEPFAVVLPLNYSKITLYDKAGNIVTLYDTFTG